MITTHLGLQKKAITFYLQLLVLDRVKTNIMQFALLNACVMLEFDSSPKPLNYVLTSS